MSNSVDEFMAYRGQIVDGGQSFDGAVVVSGNSIVEVLRAPANGNLPAKQRSSRQIWPGLIDMQVNGAFGREVDGDADSFRHIAGHLSQVGVTSFVPTLISSPGDHYFKVFAAYQRFIQRHNCSLEKSSMGKSVDGLPNGAHCCGLHLEGPFVSTTQSGIHCRQAIQDADDNLFDTLLEDSSWMMMTLAPERPGNIAKITRLRERGTLVSIGHSEASIAEFRAGVTAGATMVTHLYNAMSGFHHRAPGVVAATWLESGVVASVIADGLHCSAESLELAFRLKGSEGLVLVSDSMAAAGLGAGRYSLAGQPATVEAFRFPQDSSSDDDVFRAPASSFVARNAEGKLAGAVLTLDQAVHNMAAYAQIPLEQAVRMASEIPAKVLGLSQKGRIRAGADADLLLIGRVADQDLGVEATLVAGKIIFDREQKSLSSIDQS